MGKIAFRKALHGYGNVMFYIFSNYDFIIPVCQLGYEPDGAGGCKTCDKDWFREDLSTSNCTACVTLDPAFVTNSTTADNSSLCRKLNFTKYACAR